MITRDGVGSRGRSNRGEFEAVVGRFEDASYDAVLGNDDPRISTKRHRQTVRRAEVRGNRLALFAVLGTIGAVSLAPIIAKAVLALTPERFACDPNAPQKIYHGPNAFSVATQINREDWQDVPLRQSPDSPPVAAANMAYIFTGSAYGPENC